MTVDEILCGEISERPCHARHPMTEAEARHVLRQIEKQMPKKRRGTSVRFFASSQFAKLSPEARGLYVSYAEAYGA